MWTVRLTKPLSIRPGLSLNQMVNRVAGKLDLDAIFAALAHPIRRAILEQLAGLLVVEPEGRVHRCQIDAAPLSAAFGWLTRYRVLWEDRFDRLAKHLEENR